MEAANTGDVILFKREGKQYEGTVVSVRESTVIVEYGVSKIKDEPLLTVVNHKNYTIKK